MTANQYCREVMPGRGRAHIAVQSDLSNGRGLMNVDTEHDTTEPTPEIGTTRKRAKWSHEMKLFLIGLLKDHDVPGFRTWSKEAWTNIVCRLNAKFGCSFILNQVKQKEQNLKKDYRVVKELQEESGFGWDSERKMVTAPPNVWANFASRKNNSDALTWQDKSFPYFDDLFALYDGHYAEGRTRHGMDHYANKPKNASNPSTQQAPAAETYQSPSPAWPAEFDSGLQFPFDEEAGVTPVQHMQTPPSSTPTPLEGTESRRGKKQKAKSCSPEEGFHERYLKLKREEIDRFAAIEEKKLEDPYSINKCITVLESLNDLQMGDILLASDIFQNKNKRKVFLSFQGDAIRLAWVKREIGCLQAEKN
ncbi:hypothetical protein GQ55_9G122100 [Panicum hallii var. hallii]|uniref:Myb/SANT-like domain-containing protein n=1 Tax=Panicum hallii var. hallii TaxID=1504633 RepID=A0A2T7C2A3_9POAL|nr:hypothetical protein GQ55_9G122100 [Panicum hallii var. hallii]